MCTCAAELYKSICVCVDRHSVMTRVRMTWGQMQVATHHLSTPQMRAALDLLSNTYLHGQAELNAF